MITNPWAGHSSVWGRQSYMGGKGGDICEDEVYNDIPLLLFRPGNVAYNDNDNDYPLFLH